MIIAPFNTCTSVWATFAPSIIAAKRIEIDLRNAIDIQTEWMSSLNWDRI